MEQGMKQKPSVRLAWLSHGRLLRKIHRVCPAYLTENFLIAVLDSVIHFVGNIFLVRYALNGINQGLGFPQIALLIVGWLAVQLLLKGIHYGYDVREKLRLRRRLVMALSEETAQQAELLTNRFSHLILLVITFFTNFFLLAVIDPVLLLLSLVPLLSLPLRSREKKIISDRESEAKEANRRRNYAYGAFYLADYAKEMRLTAMPGLLLRQFRDAGGEVVRLIKKHGLRLATLAYIADVLTEVVIELGVSFYGVYCTMVSRTMGYGDCLVVVTCVANLLHSVSHAAEILSELQGGGGVSHEL